MSPTTSPVARFETTSPTTVELGSLIRTTCAACAPIWVIRPASAPPWPTTTSPTARPSAVPRSIVTIRFTSATSRPITRAATVAYWNESRIWSSDASCSFSGASAWRRMFSAVSRWLSAWSVPLSRRSWSISWATDVELVAMSPTEMASRTPYATRRRRTTRGARCP